MKTTSSFRAQCAARLVRSLTLLAAILGWAVLQSVTVQAVPTNSPPRVLVMDETINWGTNSWEVLAAQAAIPGCVVDIVTPANWYFIPPTGNAGPTGYGFDQYRAIVVGDPACNTSTPGYLAALNALNATKTNWTPAATGTVILLGIDNACHAWGTNGAAKTINRGIAFAVNDPTKTGFYYALSCYYDYTAPATNAVLVPHLTGFGTFMTRNYPNTCFNDAHIVATHPIFTNTPPLTDAELSNWWCSTHEGFDVWPSSFVVLAIALTNGAYTATDGSNGVPYILVRGEGVKVISTIELGPPVATNNLGTPHTVCATISTNVTPYIGVPVTFTITNGPNAVTNFTSLTDSNGVACFTYTGNGGLGTDYIIASYMNDHDHVITSGTVTKLWVGACINVGCPVVECLSDGKWSYKFCVTNLTGSPLNYVSLLNPPAGVSFTPSSIIPLSPPLPSGQSTNLAVIINGPATLGSLCFKLGAHTTNEVTPNCTIPVCLTLSACCNRVLTNSLTWVSVSGLTSTYSYSITLQNVTASPLRWVGFGAAQSCLVFLPPLVDLTLPAYGGGLLLPGQTRSNITVLVQRTAPCTETNFSLSTFDTNFTACCSTKMALPPPKCVKIISPYDGSAILVGTPVLMRAAPIVSYNPCNFKWIKFYSGTTFVGDGIYNPGGGTVGSSGPSYDLTVTNLPPGTHRLVAVAELGEGEPGTGEVESSEEVELTVLSPEIGHEHEAPTLSVGVTDGNILINLPTAMGHQYELQYRTSLSTGEWKTLHVINGNGTVMTVHDSMTNDPVRFYRTVQSP